jgi:hypothetical protein
MRESPSPATEIVCERLLYHTVDVSKSSYGFTQEPTEVTRGMCLRAPEGTIGGLPPHAEFRDVRLGHAEFRRISSIFAEYRFAEYRRTPNKPSSLLGW